MKLAAREWDRLANILDNLGQVAAGSIVVPFFLDEYNPLLALLGIGLAMLLLSLSVLAQKRAI